MEIKKKFLLSFGFFLFSIVSSANGSCWRYGHSCWGGHGKRSDPLTHSFQRNKFDNVLEEPPDTSQIIQTGNEHVENNLMKDDGIRIDASDEIQQDPQIIPLKVQPFPYLDNSKQHHLPLISKSDADSAQIIPDDGTFQHDPNQMDESISNEKNEDEYYDVMDPSSIDVNLIQLLQPIGHKTSHDPPGKRSRKRTFIIYEKLMQR